MTPADWGVSAGAAWLLAALALGVAELVVPGVFLVFLAIAAAVTGVTALAIDVAPAAQLASFAVWSVATVLVGRRWYRDYPQVSSDPLLNDRAARMIGQRVMVAHAIEGGHGRVRVGDGEWPARGPDLPTGAAARVVAVEGGVVMVAAVPDSPPDTRLP